MSRYKVVQELGRNQEGGRITYLATDTSLDPPVQVVIKEFRFAASGANWSGFKAYEREIAILQQMEHPRIPRYLNSYETETGFCLVQEYKNAPSLAERSSFTPEDIKQIAESVLEILVYLQQRTPPVIHRDIKPENILVDKQLNAYLVDFGFARIRGGELALSSVAAGTPGFMPPEEQLGRPLTEASDIYSVGATLICLLTGTRSLDVSNLIDDDYRFDFKKLVPQLSLSFISWLEKMVTPNVKQRYGNAATALEALKPLQVVGGVTWQEDLVAAVKRRRLSVVLGRATLGVIVGLSTVLIMSQQPRSVRRLLETKECEQCHLRNADLEGADLEGAFLAGADLLRANLSGTNLKDADLRRAQLGVANLKQADLRGANLRGVNLTSADLRDTNLAGADLWGASLARANLQGADLRGVQLGGADLRGAQLEGANLKSANLKGVIMPDGTKHE